MVAASVVLTVLVLNYHHRNPDTHNMPTWVETKHICLTKVFFIPAEQKIVPAMAAVASTLQPAHQENHHEIHSNGSQNGCKDFKIQLCAKFPDPSENSSS